MKKPDLVNAIGKGIRVHRQRLHLTIEQLAEAAGIGANYLSHIETGSKTPSLSLLAKLLAALDISPKALFDAAPGRVPAEDGDDLERKIRVLVRGLSKSQRLDLIAVLSRMRAGEQIKGLRNLLRA